eukprot:5599770-Alexandrium_andersonii.AAC.1
MPLAAPASPPRSPSNRLLTLGGGGGRARAATGPAPRPWTSSVLLAPRSGGVWTAVSYTHLTLPTICSV